MDAMMIGSMTAEATESDGIRACFVFSLDPEVPGLSPGAVRNGADLLISGKIADGLRAKGFRITEPVHGKPEGAEVFDVRLSGFDVVVVIFPEGASELHEYRMRTSCLRPFWRRVPHQSVSEGWIHVCAAIEKTLREDLKAASISWLT